ncbi:hypothetical protein [Novosphingobium sp.]|jgi:hypothetical protein|uniref:hypothetical protein n=1 Tax=Novosphingobium sp. TaxID=1874826 RepID=UPI003D6D8D8D
MRNLPFRLIPPVCAAVCAAICSALSGPAFASGQEAVLTPLALSPGLNAVPDIAGTGQEGSIAQLWRQNNKVRGQHIFLVKVGEIAATLEGREQIIDMPHVGDDVIRSVRFARGNFRGKSTLYMLIASRDVGTSPYEAATTHIQSFALVQDHAAFDFAPVRSFVAAQKYCHADAALLAELNFPLSPIYAGRVTPTGC